MTGGPERPSTGSAEPAPLHTTAARPDLSEPSRPHEPPAEPATLPKRPKDTSHLGRVRVCQLCAAVVVADGVNQHAAAYRADRERP